MLLLIEFLFLLATPVEANNVVAFPLNQMSGPRCEVNLTKTRLRRHRVDKLLLSKFDVRAHLDENVTALGLHAFGLDYVRSGGTTSELGMRVKLVREHWWLEIISRDSGARLFAIDLTDVPMREWIFPGAWSQRQRSFGLRWSGGPMLSRYYYSVQVERRMRRYTIGLDVGCSRVRRFTEGPVTESVLGEDNWLCRVPVLTFRRRMTRD